MIRVMKVCSNDGGYIAKMADMPYVVKLLKKKSSLEPKGQNDNHWVTLIFFYRKVKYATSKRLGK